VHRRVRRTGDSLLPWVAPLAVLVLTLGWAPAARAAGTIRVAVVEGARTVEVGGGPMVVSDAAGRPLTDDTPTWLRVIPQSGGVEVRSQGAGGVQIQRAASVRLTPIPGGGLRLNGRDYPGVLEVARDADVLVAINDLPLEEYLAGAVKAEAGDRMPLEMLKAQAIAARTYAAYQRQLNGAKLYHIVASTAHQQYAGRVAPDSPAWTAVRQTQGEVLLWQGSLFPAFYHTDSGGHTEDPRAVFAASNMPALRAVRVEFPSASPYQRWRLEMPRPARQGRNLGGPRRRARGARAERVPPRLADRHPRHHGPGRPPRE